jgi:cysteinyl-tRNA synthetase
MKHLGESFDLHSGGVDLIFPHHENEIAQSEAATGKPFSQHWLHVAHLTVEGRKMSKSLGNLCTLEALAKRGHTPMELRYVLLSGGYRQQLNFTFESLTAARKALAKLADWQRRLGGPPDFLLPGEEDFGPFTPVYEALQSDLNTSEALGRLHSLSREIVTAAEAGHLPPHEIEAAQHGIALVLQCLGLTLSPSDKSANSASETAPPWIHALAAERLEARYQQDWNLADQLRQKVHDEGWAILDGNGSFTLQPLCLNRPI